jgi:hypothetical protein
MIVCFVDVVVFLVFRNSVKMIDDCLFCRCGGHYCVQRVLLG